MSFVTKGWVRLLMAVTALGLAIAAVVLAIIRPAFGRGLEGDARRRALESDQWREDRFANVLPTSPIDSWKATKEYFAGGSDHRVPEKTPAVRARVRSDYDDPPETGLRFTWLGHSTILLEIDGVRVLIDPVWGPTSSPVSWAGPKRFYRPPLPIDQLPEIDIVIISHDHYDHLDYPTVVQLASRPIEWVVPLGVASDLEYWGVARDRTTELDWWESVQLSGLELTATPARHFSGRLPIFDGDRSLWSGWAVRGPVHNVYYSGDTALFNEVGEIGERLGPFDLTMIEAGAYDQLWRDVHLGPEQAVRVHELVRGRVMLPVHWGLFDLALHGWTEPIERVRVEAERRGIIAIHPMPGEMIEPGALPGLEQWWPDIRWESAEEAPVDSSGLEPGIALE